MKPALSIELEPPGIAVAMPFAVAGLKERFTRETMKGIPSLWRRFVSQAAAITGRVQPQVNYGICSADEAGSFSYLAGVEVLSSECLPPGFSLISIPKLQYAVFRHHGHVSGLAETLETIWSSWLPASGYRAGRTPGAPQFFERYGAKFDPARGSDDIEIWVPVTN